MTDTASRPDSAATALPAAEDVPAVPSTSTRHETVVVLDFGSQFTRLIARRIRECRVYCELLPPSTPWSEIVARRPKGVVLSGGPASVYDPGAPQAPPELWESGIPVLGICYGMGLLAHGFGGETARVEKREYGPATLDVVPGGADVPGAALFDSLPARLPVWMSHGDALTRVPAGFHVLAHTANAVAAIADDRGHVGVQFHPEVVHTPRGKDIIDNFLKRICGCRGDWTPGNVIADSIARIRAQVGGSRVICALSGGVDSAVAATLISRAIGDQLTCVFVDNGLLRKDEAATLMEVFKEHLGIPVVHVDAVDRFLRRLAGVIDPEEKRRIVGDEFIRVFAEQARLLSAQGGPIEFLAQGTLYPDVIESTSHDTVNAARIKTHHNVGGLPEDLPFRLVEPLRYLFKDEVREVGRALGLPERMVSRQPFPGPGLSIRVIGEVTHERLETLRAADAIVVEEIRKAGLYRELWQSFAILTPVKSVGVMGDYRTYADVVAVRAVTSDDAMTADWARLPYEVLATISNRIVNEVQGVNRVVYDISSKPPSTIEWE
ncbi:MAG TPA: glutamine-hydrolyzing GMP synthase [Chloroflexota bacterium]|nr:glutamine-hydrolyzing GMP synthase [Chloroflexota bacterium]